jgi:hypothetical protein
VLVHHHQVIGVEVEGDARSVSARRASKKENPKPATRKMHAPGVPIWRPHGTFVPRKCPRYGWEGFTVACSITDRRSRARRRLLAFAVVDLELGSVAGHAAVDPARLTRTEREKILDHPIVLELKRSAWLDEVDTESL